MTNGQEERINYLVNEIKRHRYLYYNEQPEISDAKYDALEDELRKLDPGDSIMMPTRIKIDRPDPAPSSDDTSFFNEWNQEHEEIDVNSVLNAWRRQED